MQEPVRVRVEVTKYQDLDGRIHDTLKEAESANERIRERNDPVLKFSRTYGGKRLLEKYGRSHYGIWEVRGEDNNADMGGSHHEPLLGFFQGTLEEVINKAYTLKGFTTWGGGGSIKLNTPEKVTVLSEPKSTFIDRREFSTVYPAMPGTRRSDNGEA